MAAVVRVKRRRSDDPADSIVFSSKRRQLDESNLTGSGDKCESFKSQFKFAGTVGKKEDHVSKPVRDAIRKAKLEREYKLHAVGEVVVKQRETHECRMRANRCKIISNKRSLDLDTLNTDAASDAHLLNVGTEENAASRKVFCFYDVIPDSIGGGDAKPSSKECPDVTTGDRRSEITCNGVSLIREKASTELTEDEEDYVYDIYYMNSGKFDFHELESDLTVEAMYQDMMVYDEYRASECTEAYEYDDDSNDEDNWRNDYPDEDPKFFENEDTEYRYGCDGSKYEEFGTEADMSEVNSMLHRGLRLSNGEPGSDEGALSSDAEDDHVYFSPPQQPTDLWAPQTSWEKYKERVSKDLERSEDAGGGVK